MKKNVKTFGVSVEGAPIETLGAIGVVEDTMPFYGWFNNELGLTVIAKQVIKSAYNLRYSPSAAPWDQKVFVPHF